MKDYIQLTLEFYDTKEYETEMKILQMEMVDFDNA